MQLIDLSVTLDNNKQWAPWWARNTVKRQGHRFGRISIWILFRITPKFLRNGLGWAHDVIKLSTHGTTHLDAPWHFAPESEGRKAKTIDEIPLEWCYGNGVVLDMRHKNNQDHDPVIRIDDLKDALKKIDYQIQPKDIVLIQTGNDRLIGDRRYFDQGPGVSAQATRWILDHGVKITGIDSWGWDIPLKEMARKTRKEDKKDYFWEAHYVGVDKEYCHLERLANLDRLPAFGSKICCFPLKIRGGSAGPCRVVAMIDK